MSARLRFALLALGVALVAAGAGWWIGQAWYGPGAAIGNDKDVVFIDAVFNDLDGKPRHMQEWAGRPIVLNFWATWCPPCREEIPLFVDMQQEYGDAVQFIGIALEEPREVADFARQFGINYPLLVSPGAEGFALMDRYGNARNALPFTVIFDANGRIVERHAGAYRRFHLQKTITPLVASTAPNPAK